MLTTAFEHLRSRLERQGWKIIEEHGLIRIFENREAHALTVWVDHEEDIAMVLPGRHPPPG